MREKAIEKLREKKPKAFGKRITVQQLDSIVILNIYYNKILQARYCINSKTGEYETLDYSVTNTGTWKTTKLGAQFGMEPRDYNYYSYRREWMNDDKKLMSAGDHKILEDILQGNDGIFREIERLEEKYSMGKRERAAMNHQERVRQELALTPDVPADIWDWIEEIADGKAEYALKDEDGRWTCSACGKHFQKERLKTEDKKKPKNDDIAICPECGKKIIYKARKRKIDTVKCFVLIQPVDDKRGIVRFFHANIYCLPGNKKEVLIDEDVRIMLYKGQRRTDCKIYYNQRRVGDCARKKRNMDNLDRLFWDKRQAYGSHRTEYPGPLYDGGIKEALKDTAYSGWADLFAQMAEAKVEADYNLLLVKKNDRRFIGMIEMLFRNRFYRLLYEESKQISIWDGQYHGSLDMEAEDIEEVFDIYDRQKINRIRDRNGGYMMVRWMRYSDENDEKISDKAMEWIAKNNISVGESEEILNYMSVEKMMNYVTRQQKESYPGKSASAVIDQYNDYLSMCEKLHKDLSDEMVYRPRELKRRHDEAVKEIELRRAELDAEKYSKKYAEAEQVLGEIKPKLEYAGEKYFIMVPQRIVDIVKEGQSLHHCVGSTDRYFDRIKQHETYICFLRKKEAPDEAYYTIEVEPGGTIRQHRGAFDEEPELDEVKPFLREWQKEIKKRMSKEDKERAAVSKVKREKNIMDLREKNNTRVLNGLLEDFMEAM